MKQPPGSRFREIYRIKLSVHPDIDQSKMADNTCTPPTAGFEQSIRPSNACAAARGLGDQ